MQFTQVLHLASTGFTCSSNRVYVNFWSQFVYTTFIWGFHSFSMKSFLIVHILWDFIEILRLQIKASTYVHQTQAVLLSISESDFLFACTCKHNVFSDVQKYLLYTFRREDIYTLNLKVKIINERMRQQLKPT